MAEIRTNLKDLRDVEAWLPLNNHPGIDRNQIVDDVYHLDIDKGKAPVTAPRLDVESSWEQTSRASSTHHMVIGLVSIFLSISIKK